MMMNLFAAAPDGWALVQQDGESWLFRPPYGRANRYRLGERQLSRVLANGDFETVEHSFEDWGELCRFLKQRRIESASPEDLESAKDAAERLLKRATPSQAERHLDTIEAQLEDGKCHGPENALMVLLEAPAVDQDPDLRKRTVELLRRAQQPRLQIAADPPQAAWRVRDEWAVAKVDEDIAQRGSVLPHAA